jgi:hypothetical protein
MNEAILTQLKIIVEHAVRPVRASQSRKQKMRLELLAHVSAVFEEQYAQLNDEASARQCTEQRFGNPAELTEQLQSSIPMRDRVVGFLDELFSFPPHESTLRRAIRHGMVVCLMALAAGSGALLGALLLVARVRQPHVFAVAATGVLALAVVGSVLMVLGHAMCAALYAESGRSRGRALLIAAASGFLVPLVTFVLCLVWSGHAWSSLVDALWLLPPAALLTPIAVMLIARGLDAEIRAYQEWAELPIHPENGAPA